MTLLKMKDFNLFLYLAQKAKLSSKVTLQIKAWVCLIWTCAYINHSLRVTKLVFLDSLVKIFRCCQLLIRKIFHQSYSSYQHIFIPFCTVAKMFLGYPTIYLSITTHRCIRLVQDNFFQS